jgi:hypothetical protein
MNYLFISTCKISFLIFPFFLISEWTTQILAQGIIVDHTCTEITEIPESAINQAKATLHIGYGHTSHGSQLTTGMTGLVSFANNGGLGLSHPQNIFEWNNGGNNGALDLEEGDGYGTGWLDHDCGYYPNWVDETREYLDDPSHADVNVIIWSWCGQVSGRSEQEMIETYLDPMSQLESEYPSVKFVYMTGHADGSGLSGNLHLRNQQIRNYCIANNKVLYDFYDIECYDPDNTYFGDKNVNDDCSYTGGNWAIEWQSAHIEGVDWYNCSAAHTQPLNANQKAYTAWWLWARLAGWDPVTEITEPYNASPKEFKLFQNYPNPFNPSTTINFSIPNSGFTQLKVYNTLGKEVQTLVNENKQAGKYQIEFNAENLSNGMYVYRLVRGKFSETKKMILLK